MIVDDNLFQLLDGAEIKGGIGDVFVFWDQKTTATNGGTFTAGAWRTRVVNTQGGTDDNRVTMASNRFTLAPGTYHIEAQAPACLVGRHQLRIQNVTDGVTSLLGTSSLTTTFAGIIENRLARLVGVIVVPDTDLPKQYELQHRSQLTRAIDGFGQAVGFGSDEIYSIVSCRKL